MGKHNPYWITGGTWYNTSIFEKIYVTVLEEMIRNSITDRYNYMCSIWCTLETEVIIYR